MKRQVSIADAVGTLVATAVYWVGALSIGSVWRGADGAPVSWRAWGLLYAGCLVVGWACWHVASRSTAPTRWLVAAVYCALFAAVFYGANGGLDALHGAHRHKSNVAESLMGVELWMVLLPGGFSIAFGGWARGLSSRIGSTLGDDPR